MNYRCSFLIQSIAQIISAMLLSSTALALSPQQYCEALQNKSPGSFEMLNIDGGGGESTVTSKIVKEIAMTGDLTHSSVQPYSINVVACGNTYNFSGKIEGNPSVVNLMVSGTKFSLTSTSPEYPTCASTTASPICTDAACFEGTSGTLANASQAKLPLPQPEAGCMNNKGITFKNGNSCTVSDFQVKLDNNASDSSLSWKARVTIQLTETRVDSSNQMRVKYCAKGMFHFATVRSGPMSQKYDSVINCVRSNGQSFPKPYSRPPLQGELMSDLKYWLVDKEGCGG